MFDSGEQVYTPTGLRAEFDHAVGANAYVRPILVTTVQSTSYHGDSYEEHEIEEAAEHLIVVPLSKLSSTPPVQAADAAVTAKLAELEELNRRQEATKKEYGAELRQLKEEMRSQMRAMEEWAQKYPWVKQAVDLVEGRPLFPLKLHVGRSNEPSNYPPDVPDEKELKFLILKPVRTKGELSIRWAAAIPSRSTYDRYSEWEVTFFDNEEARRAFVRGLFENRVEVFMRKPQFEDRYGGLTYAELLKWPNVHPYLTMPQVVLDAKAAYEEEKNAARRAALQKQLEALGDAA